MYVSLRKEWVTLAQPCTASIALRRRAASNNCGCVSQIASRNGSVGTGVRIGQGLALPMIFLGLQYRRWWSFLGLRHHQNNNC